MNRLYVLGVLSIIISCSLTITSCEYEFIEVELPDPSITVSFQHDILPIFNNNNNCTGCHKTGATAPNLIPSHAYEAIALKLIDTEQPELSKIYTVASPSSTTHSFKKYTPTQAALVLEWIKQGAENN
jgi:hypothetical protein